MAKKPKIKAVKPMAVVKKKVAAEIKKAEKPLVKKPLLKGVDVCDSCKAVVPRSIIRSENGGGGICKKCYAAKR